MELAFIVSRNARLNGTAEEDTVGKLIPNITFKSILLTGFCLLNSS
jgi:hypothetical protein